MGCLKGRLFADDISLSRGSRWRTPVRFLVVIRLFADDLNRVAAVWAADPHNLRYSALESPTKHEQTEYIAESGLQRGSWQRPREPVFARRPRLRRRRGKELVERRDLGGRPFQPPGILDHILQIFPRYLAQLLVDVDHG